MKITFKDIALIVLFGVVAYLWFFRDNSTEISPHYLKELKQSQDQINKLDENLKNTIHDIKIIEDALSDVDTIYIDLPKDSLRFRGSKLYKRYGSN